MLERSESSIGQLATAVDEAEKQLAQLRKVVDPEKADALARSDQAAKIAALGGKAAILAKGSFGHSPVPGTTAVYAT